MHKIIPAAATLSFLLAACEQVPTEQAVAPEMLELPEGYELVWSDEFDVDGLPDESKWAYDTHRNTDGWYNEELQYYPAARLKNSRIEDGKLIIEAHAETVSSEEFADWGGQTYTSARLFTRGKAAWQYGYFEIRASVPCGKGFWPAIWTLPEGDFAWPDDGEIDIMEYVGWDADHHHATVHTGDNNHTMGTHFGSSRPAENACGEFFTHTLHWTEDGLRVAVDGEVYFTYDKEGKGYGHWPFDRPHNLIMNVAVGGWGGKQGIDPDIFPGQMQIDYVRIYQKP